MQETTIVTLASFLSEKKEIDLHFPTAFTSNGELIEGTQLCREEKQKHLENLLRSDVPLFLERHGNQLERQHLDLFSEVESLKDNYEVQWYLRKFRGRLNKSTDEALREQRTIVRNRRMKYLEKLENDGEYFSEIMMKIRQPVLYQEYIGKYKPTLACTIPFGKETKLYERLLLNCDLCEANEIILRSTSAPPQQEEEEEEEEENENENENESDKKEDLKNSNEYNVPKKTVELIRKDETEVSIEKELNEFNQQADYEDFLSIMKENFLSGRDVDFNYSEIDQDDSLDDLSQLDRDEQEKYFDTD